MAAALICGASVFTSCSDNEDNPATPDLNLSEKIIGTWITADVNGQPALTDKKRVVTFVSATKAYYSSSRTTRPEVEATWSGTRVDSVSWKSRFGDVIRPTHINHANDEMLTKGFRRYEMKLKGGTELVVYDMHMEASDDETEATGEDAVDRRSRMVQYRDLRDHIMKHLDKRPIVVVGDMNSYYERDSVEIQFIDEINKSGRATIGDVWIELERGGKYPALEKGVVMQDLGSRGWSRKGQVLDKIFYVNPVDAVRRLKPVSVTVDSVGYVREDGWTPLGDHSPLSAVFCFVK